MSIHFSTYIDYRQLDAGTKNDLIADLKQQLEDVNWTTVDIAAEVIGTFTGVPANNETITIDGKVFTWKTTLTGAANEIFRGVDAAACASNLFDAITDNTPNEGTTYGTGTVAHTTCTAVLNGAAVTIKYLTAGVTGNGVVVAEGMSNFTFNSLTLFNGGHVATSTKTAHGMQMKLRMGHGPVALGNYVYLTPMNMDEDVTNTQAFWLLTVGGRLLESYACEFQLFICLLADSSVSNVTSFDCGVPYIRQQHRAKIISSIADNGSGLIRVTTATNHGKATGETVYIAGGTKSGGTVMTALNGSWPVTVISATQYDLDASTYEAGYDANSAMAAGTKEISRAFWADGHPSASATTTFRQGPSPTSGGGTSLGQVVCVNSYMHIQGAAVTHLQLAAMRAQASAGNAVPERSFGGYPDFLEPRIGWNITVIGGTFEWVGDLWNAFVFQDDVDMDAVSDPIDGHDFVNFMHNIHLSLFIAIN